MSEEHDFVVESSEQLPTLGVVKRVFFLEKFALLIDSILNI